MGINTSTHSQDDKPDTESNRTASASTDCLQKQVSMMRKYHNHKLQTNSLHRGEDQQDIYSNKTSKRQ